MKILTLPLSTVLFGRFTFNSRLNRWEPKTGIVTIPFWAVAIEFVGLLPNKNYLVVFTNGHSWELERDESIRISV